MGGLGNQLFQIFTAIAYSLQHQFECKLPVTVQGGRPDYWQTFLKQVKSKYVCMTRDELFRALTKPTYKEPHHHYAAIPRFSDSTVLYGYFQSPKYFENRFDEIADIIEIRRQQEEIKQKFHSRYFDTERPLLACHFRRGDYVRYPEHHPILPVTYYKAAYHRLQNTEDMLKNCDTPYRVLFFCEKDDIAVVVSQYIEPLKVEYPDYEFMWVNTDAADWEQMLIMSLCNDFVIANSTFSWWAAYLSNNRQNNNRQNNNRQNNNNSKKKVCYPSRWFGPALRNHVMTDFFPSEWSRIDF